LAKGPARETMTPVSKSQLSACSEIPNSITRQVKPRKTMDRPPLSTILSSRRPSRTDERGIALIEFALVLPMVLLLLLGMTDVGCVGGRPTGPGRRQGSIQLACLPGRPRPAGAFGLDSDLDDADRATADEPDERHKRRRLHRIGHQQLLTRAITRQKEHESW